MNVTSTDILLEQWRLKESKSKNVTAEFFHVPASEFTREFKNRLIIKFIKTYFKIIHKSDGTYWKAKDSNKKGIEFKPIFESLKDSRQIKIAYSRNSQSNSQSNLQSNPSQKSQLRYPPVLDNAPVDVEDEEVDCVIVRTIERGPSIATRLHPLIVFYKTSYSMNQQSKSKCKLISVVSNCV